MIFHPVYKTLGKPQTIGKTIVKNLNIYQYLDVIIDNNRIWSEHLETTQPKLLKIIGVLYKTMYFPNNQSLFFFMFLKCFLFE